MCAMRNSLPFISPWPLATTALKASRNSLTMAPESTPAGDSSAVTAAAGEIAVAQLANVVESGAEGGKQRGGGSISRLALGGRFALFAQVKVIARGPRGFHALPGALAHRAVGQAGGNHERFLRSADDEVHSPAIDVEVRGAESGDGVDHEQSVVSGCANEFRDSFHVVAGASRSLSGLHVDGAHAGSEARFDFVKREGLSIGLTEHIDVACVGLAERGPALAELSGRQDEDVVARRGQVRDAGLHHAGAGTSEHQDIVLGSDEFLHVGEHAGEQAAEIRSAVMGGKGGFGELGRRKERRWSGSKEAILAQHGMSPWERDGK